MLAWVVDSCYTKTDTQADGCFIALASIFGTREYNCDHYTAIINVTLMNCGCPRLMIHETALQLLQILDNRFFGTVLPLDHDDATVGGKERSTLDVLLSTTYSRSQLYLSRQLAALHAQLLSTDAQGRSKLLLLMAASEAVDATDEADCENRAKGVWGGP